MENKVGKEAVESIENGLVLSSEEFAIQAISILEDTSSEAYWRFQDLAKSIFLIPHACISLGLKGSEDLKVRIVGEIVEVPRQGSFCGTVMERSEILVVQNAIEDARFRDNPLVRDKMQIRFYAGVPLHRGSDEPFGTLCVMDTIPRTFDQGRLTILRDLGRQIVELIEIEVQNRFITGGFREETNIESSQTRLNTRTQTAVEKSSSLGFEISLDDQIDRIFDLFSDEAGAKGVELVSNISEDLRVVFDQDALWMVLRTTIFNGIKYCIMGGSVKVDAWKSARHLIVSISDSGAGMPAGKVQEVMSEAPAVSGLAVCRRLLESNNGQMDILSEKGMGTTITLTFPAQ